LDECKKTLTFQHVIKIKVVQNVRKSGQNRIFYIYSFFSS
jgi:RNA-binding protein YhbY